MLTILALAIEQIINENLVSFSKQHVYKQPSDVKNASFSPL